MDRRVLRNVVLGAACCSLLALSSGCNGPGAESFPVLPDGDAKLRKAAFFDYLRPIITFENHKIAEDRRWLVRVAQREQLGWLSSWQLRRLATRYRVSLDAPHEEVAASLLRRVDIVPVSLALAQAAKESGWGRSRFAREGNALFGERCFEPGCGLVPAARAKGAYHEVERFPTVAASVESYLLNINSHERYAALRRERQRLRKEELLLTGSALARFATPYSERREAYVEEIIELIAYNRLETVGEG